MIKVISFDMDGTLVSEDFDNAIWREDLPKIYAEKKNISLEKAKEYCFSKYKEHLGHNKWTSLAFWFEMFGLNNWQELIKNNLDKIKIYKETKEILQKLSKNYRLIVFTQAPKEFFEIKLKELSHYFEKIYSSTHHFNSLQKNKEIYKKIIEDLKINKDEILHIGNLKEYDYDIPNSMGIKAVLLDRENRFKKEKTVKDLNDFREYLESC